MSVHELEAQLEKLSADIALHQKILNDLQQNKINVQRQLNTIRDPVARLPLEISSEIFVRCLPPFPEPGAHHVPMLFLNICNAWTNIALSIPALWAAINIVFPRAEGFTELLATWLKRARTRPLSVSLSNNFDDSDGIIPFIWRHGQQLKHLEICCNQEDDEDEIIHILGCSSPGPLPLLETLTVQCLIYEADDLSYRGLEILELLRLAPNLVECMFHYVRPVHGVDDIEESLVHPGLRRLMFGDGVNDPESDDRILTCLTTPGLEALSASMHISSDELWSFLKRSSPPLQELVLGGGLDYDNLDGLHGCLRLIPTLVRLEFWWWPETHDLEELFGASPSGLLPNLRSLSIRLASGATLSDFWWETLLGVLQARRTKMKFAYLESGRQLSSSKLTANILAAFRELMAGGMKVYIGTHGQKLISL
ncbi:hypothetical protein B0H11DRAFT_2421557 [Mycena galericulata]|nr:hypothetical protein B0H11DRAFT_2421557 [Mycena galericulata]